MFIAESRGGHQRLVTTSRRFFDHVAAYLDTEHPAGVATQQLFVALNGPRRGHPLTAYGLDEVLEGAWRRADLTQATCHPAAAYLPDCAVLPWTGTVRSRERAEAGAEKPGPHLRHSAHYDARQRADLSMSKRCSAQKTRDTLPMLL